MYTFILILAALYWDLLMGLNFQRCTPEYLWMKWNVWVSFKTTQGQEVIKQDWPRIGNCWNQMEEGSWEFILFLYIFEIFQIKNFLNVKHIE